MALSLLPAQIVAMVPTESSCGIFLGTDRKTFLIQVDPQLGQLIDWYRQGVPHPRPLTHDLFAALLQGVGGVIQHAVIAETRDEVFYAQLRVRCEDALDRKILMDLDCRPSDAMALCVLQKAPLFVTETLLDQVEDMSHLLEQLAQVQLQSLFDADPDSFGESEEDEEDEDIDEDDDLDDEDDDDLDGETAFDFYLDPDLSDEDDEDDDSDDDGPSPHSDGKN